MSRHPLNGLAAGACALALAALVAGPAPAQEQAPVQEEAQSQAQEPAQPQEPAQAQEPAQEQQALTPTLTPAPENAYLYIGWPNPGERVRSPFKVWFGLRGMGVAPKGVAFKDTGHHHLLIDRDLPPAGEPIPADRNHLHFGAGETETRLDLPPGRHTLQLVMGDENHVMHDPPVTSRKITITVR